MDNFADYPEETLVDALTADAMESVRNAGAFEEEVRRWIRTYQRDGFHIDRDSARYASENAQHYWLRATIAMLRAFLLDESERYSAHPERPLSDTPSGVR
jgi:DNA-binding winged helix-turn-helix (wHTH) protein